MTPTQNQPSTVKIRSEFPFSLPNGHGIANESGRKVSGTMRLARVKDLIAIQQDSRVKETTSFFYVILLSRLVTKLGSERMVTTKTIENLCPEDFAFLADMANRINHQVIKRVNIKCDACGENFIGEFSLLGEA